MPLRRSARDAAALIGFLFIAIALACGGDHAVAPNDNGSMVLEEGADLDSTISVPAATLVSVTLHDRLGNAIVASRVDWHAHDHGTISPSFALTDKDGRATAQWVFGTDTGQHRATARAHGFPDVTLTSRGNAVVSPLLMRELRPLQLSTYDGSGQTVHPDYLSGDAPAFARKFLAITPYKSGDATFENPTVYASADMLRWRIPTGAPNPIVLPHASYLSDPDIVYDPALAELRVYYREVGTANTILLIRSRDAVTWTEPQSVVIAPNHEIVSPAIVRRSATDWLMWSVNAHAGCSATTADVELRHSVDGEKWTAPEPVGLWQTGFSPWHIEVQWVPSRSEYWAVYPVKTTGTCTTRALYLATSKDGHIWKTYPSPVLSRGETPALADIVYRSTFAYDAATDAVTFWYSGARYDGTNYVWSTVVQQRTRAEVFSRIAAPARANLLGPRQDTPPLRRPP